MYLSFSATKNKYSVDYSAVDAGGKTIVAPQKYILKRVDGVGKELGLRLFGIGERVGARLNVTVNVITFSKVRILFTQ